MKLVVFGLSVSSAWGNGHASVLRGLFRALERRGHRVVFFEKDAPYYAAHRDPPESWGCRLVLFSDWNEAEQKARAELADADVAMVTSYCPDGSRVADIVFSSSAPLLVFYDLDMPVTLERVKSGEKVDYLGGIGLDRYDVVLSFTGGPVLAAEARRLLKARSVEPLYGSVDPDVHKPDGQNPAYRGLLSYLGTYAADREPQVNALFFEPACRLPGERFVLGGPLYPADRRGGANVAHYEHVAPNEHSTFYCSSELTLNVVRQAMLTYGYCPSGRLFEAAASGAAMLSEPFEGLHLFFEPGREILLARTTEEAMDAVRRVKSEGALLRERARERALEQHSADCRARALESLLAPTRAVGAAL